LAVSGEGRGRSVLDPPAQVSPSRSALPRRILVAVLFLPLLWWLIRFGSWAYATFLFALVVLGSLEWEGLLRAHGLRPWPGSVVLGAAAVYGGAVLHGGERLGFVLVFLLVAYLVLELARRSGRTLELLGGVLLGALYLGLLVSFLHRLRALEGGALGGRTATYLLFLLVWGCDTFAYAVGRLAGRRRLWPAVSPAKSWEGAVGGLLGAVALGALARWGFAPQLTLAEALSLGALVGIAAPVGDLVESLLKREAGVKDSSSLIPGHGGVLDRFDAVFFCAPFVYAYLRWVAGGGS
jgi:phosphatidate cytidylyltransferase